MAASDAVQILYRVMATATVLHETEGLVVTKLVQALSHVSEGRGFDSRRSNWIFR
jgi:hypothetical protein